MQFGQCPPEEASKVRGQDVHSVFGCCIADRNMTLEEGEQVERDRGIDRVRVGQDYHMMMSFGAPSRAAAKIKVS